MEVEWMSNGSRMNVEWKSNGSRMEVCSDQPSTNANRQVCGHRTGTRIETNELKQISPLTKITELKSLDS